jgi:hypothetical protein
MMARIRVVDLCVGQALTRPATGERWLVLARDLSADRHGLLLRYIDPELGLGDVLDPYQQRRVSAPDPSAGPLPWERFEQEYDGQLLDQWQLSDDARPGVHADLMVERSRRRRAAADLVERLGQQICEVAASLRNLDERFPQEEVEVRDGRHTKILTYSPRSFGARSRTVKAHVSGLRREAEELEEWKSQPDVHTSEAGS